MTPRASEAARPARLTATLRADRSTALLRAAALDGANEIVELAGNAPLPLDDPDLLWVVERGEVDLFFVRRDADGSLGERHFVWTMWRGETVAGVRAMDAVAGGGLLLAVGFGQAAMRALPAAALDAGAGPDGERGGLALALAEGAAETIGRAMSRANRPGATILEPGQPPVTLSRGAAIVPAGSATIWVDARAGTLQFAGGGGTTGIAPPGSLTSGTPVPLPLAYGSWVSVASPEATVAATDSASVLADGRARDALRATGDAFLAWLAARATAAEEGERLRLARKTESERAMHTGALARLANLMVPAAAGRPRHGADPLRAACAIVGEAARIEFRTPPAWEDRGRWRDPVAAICRASRVRHRRVALRGEWWRGDAGPLLGFRQEGHAPVALLPSARGGYTLADPVTGERTPVTRELAAGLDPFAHYFYRSAPAGAIGFGALARMAAADTGADVRQLLGLALASSVLSVALPVATAKMFDQVIPSGQLANALALFGALLAMAIGGAAFDAARAFALLRVEGRSHGLLQAALVDRLLALPMPFFRGYTVGDLALRAESVNFARQLLTGAAVTSLLGGAVSVSNLALMFHYSGRLALVATGVLAVMAVLTAVASAYTLRQERERQTLQGDTSALVFELLGAIAKLHVAAAERRMFALWCDRFRALKRASFRAGLGAAVVMLFNEVLPILGTGLVFMAALQAVAAPGGKPMSTGEFVAFNAAFGAFLAAGIAVSNTLVSLLELVPMLERARPILATAPEVDEAKPDPGLLSGRIEAAHLVFGYNADGPPTIDDVSFQIRPGEFVAFVGPSGAGKSTILRLLLGFEQPARGAVYYDGQDLATIDVSAVRSQSAVVLQQSRLLAGDIFTNIVGASPLTQDDAWEAAAMAGLADDIRAMPMGMNTVVSEGGSVLSGGQRQRLLIARAIVRKPRIVFFDEATSALDNRAQDIVTGSLERLEATRVVIAHRLSTIRHADRIFVMAKGRVVQSGRFDELLEQPGLFQDLAARQLT